MTTQGEKLTGQDRVATDKERQVTGVEKVLADARREMIDRHVTVILTAVLFLGLWEIVGRNSHPMFMAPISEVFYEFHRELTDPRGRLQNAFMETLSVLVPGFIIACVLGVVIGLLMGRINVIYNALDPIVTVFYNTPRVVLIPILLLWLGIDNTLKITVVVLAAVFPIVVNTLTGVRDLSANFTEPARSLGATEWQLLRKVIFPASMPYIIAGLKLGLGRALTTVVVAEYFASISGLGGVLQAAASSYNMARAFVAALILAFMGILIDAFLTWLEKVTLRRYGG